MAVKAHPKIVLGVFLVLSTAACKKEAASTPSAADDGTPAAPALALTTATATPKAVSAGGLPQLSAIALSSLGQPAGPHGECPQPGSITQTVFAAACSLAPLVATAVLGSPDGDFNGDGAFNCRDAAAAKANGKEPGLMLDMLCRPAVQNHPGLVSLMFQENGTDLRKALSFRDYSGGQAGAGAWTRGNAASYPLSLRLWEGASSDALDGVLSLLASDLDHGDVALSLLSGKQPTPFTATLRYANQPSTKDCSAAPGPTTCHWQEIELYQSEAALPGGLTSGAHLKIYADDKERPSFLAIEGRLRLSAATVAAWVPKAATEACLAGDLAQLRSVYLQVVQKGSQVWGHYSLRDENDAPLSCVLPETAVDPYAMLAADSGVCQDLGSDAWVSCKEIRYSDYSRLWTGEQGFANVTTSPVATSWDGAPRNNGLCTTAGCQPVVPGSDL